MAEQSALEEHLRRQGWEEGNIDYMGKDSFSHIWQKICDTLAGGSQPSTVEAVTSSASEVSTTPVAPVAAPVFVSSVEMSPSGPIDTSPPASYVPVSSFKSTVVDSDTEATSKVASAETTTVIPEPKSSVTEVIPTEASVPSSASVDTSVQPGPVPSGETPALQDSAAPTLPAVHTTTPESLTSSQALVQGTVSSEVTGQTPVTSIQSQKIVGSKVEVPIPDSIKTDIPTSPPLQGEIPALLQPETTIKSDTVLALVETSPSPDKPAEVVSIPAAIVSTEVSAPVIAAEAAAVTAETTPADIPTSTTQIETVVNPTVEAAAGVPVPITPAEPIVTPGVVEITPVTSVKAVSTPPGLVPAENLTPSTQSETVITKKDALPVDSVASVVTLTSDTSNVTSIAQPPGSTSLVSTQTPIVLPLETTPIAESQLPPVIPSVLASNDVPLIPVKSEPAVSEAAEVPKANISKDEPTAELPSQTTQGTTERQASDIAKPIQSTPEQPQTPTVIEPTPPTSPPEAPVESPLETKLQVEAELPATPPVESGASQPSLATASTEEPPVPPKRKGGAKASQETKNTKGGKQTKGKK